VRYAPGGGLAKFLGWFSIGLGLTEILAHRPLAKAIGVDDHPALMPLLGVREIASGIGILADPDGRPTAGMWSRVVGDAMDLNLLGAAMVKSNGSRDRVALATAAVVGVTVLDVLASLQLGAASALEPY